MKWPSASPVVIEEHRSRSVILSAYLAGHTERCIPCCAAQIILLSFAKMTAKIWLTSGFLVLVLTF